MGQARGQPGGAGDVARLRPDGVDAPKHDVVDRERIDIGAFEQRLDRVGAQIGRVDFGQATIAPANRCADGVDDVRLGHGSLPHSCVLGLAAHDQQSNTVGGGVPAHADRGLVFG